MKNDAHSASAIATPAAAEAEPAGAQEQVGDEGDQPHEDADERGEADVVVAHVGHLVGDDALELVAVELVEQPPGDRDRAVRRVASRGEGVRRRVLDDVDRRRLPEPGGDRHLLDDVPQARLLLVRDAPRATHGEHHPVAGVVADEAPDDRRDTEEADEAEPAVVRPDPGEADHVAQGGEDDDDDGHEQPGGPPVAADLLVHASLPLPPPSAAGRHRRSTLGTTVSASGASKNSRAVKLNIPAMMLVGNIWMALL